MTITATQLHPHFMAEIGGVDLRQPVTPALFAEIEAAFDEHAILLFRGQPITDEQHVAFSALFGPVFKATKYHIPNERRRVAEEMADISNIDQAGKILAADDARRLHAEANQLWHTDNTFKHIPSRCSLLLAHEIPAEGGNTEFADMRAAYDALPEAKKREIDDLVVEHSIFHSREKMGYTGYTDAARAELPPVQQVLVRTHPATGRKGLYIASHAARVIGWPVEKGRALIEELLDFATQPRFVYAHEWRAGDLILWDNRCTMHRATTYDDKSARRVLQRTTVSDEINTVERRGMEQAGAA